MKNVKKIYTNRTQLYNKGNKGVIDVQFNWIFVLIAGVILFLFIIGIALTQRGISEKENDAQIVVSTTALLKGKQTANVFSEVSIPKSDIIFTCDNYTNTFNFKVNSQRTDLPVSIIFAPKAINTNKIQIWTKEFTLGFPVSIFTYITTADSMILIYNVSRQDLVQKLYIGLPNNISKKAINNQQSLNNYANRDNTKIICFDTCPVPSYNYIQIYPIDSSGEGFGYGTVTFH